MYPCAFARRNRDPGGTGACHTLRRMTQAVGRPQLKLRRALPLLVLVLGCAQFAIHYGWSGWPFLDLGLYTREVIPMPYQGRVLMAWVFQATAARPGFYAFVTHFSAHLPVPLRSPYVVVEVAFVFVALLVAGLACRGTIRRLGADRAFADWACLLLLGMAACITFCEDYIIMAIPYDIPSIAFFSVGIWLVVARRWWLLLPVFMLGTLNRETYIFLTVFLVLYEGFSAVQRGRTLLSGVLPVLPSVVVQVVIWVGIHVWALRRFAGNAGPHDPKHGVVFQFGGNLHSLVNPSQWPLLGTVAALLVLPVVLGWRWIPDRAFARATACILVLWALGMTIVGVLVEVRIFNELVSFVAPCAAIAIWTRYVGPSRASGVEEAA